MKNRRYFPSTLDAIACAVLATLFLVACNQSQPPATTPMAPESKAVATKDVYLVFEGPWAFAPDPKDANSVVALAPRTKGHHDLVVQSSDNVLAPGVYDLLLPVSGGSAAGTVDANILRAKIDPQSVQHVLDSKSGRYVIRLPKPDAYIEATHHRSRAGATYPPDVSTEKDYVTSVSLHYIVTSFNGFSLSGTPDSGVFNPLLLQAKTPAIDFAIDPVQEDDKCHSHERESFRDLAKLVNVTVFLDFPSDAADCHAKDPQNAHPAKAEIAPRLPGFLARAAAGGFRQHLLAAIYFFGGQSSDCKAPIIVSGD